MNGHGIIVCKDCGKRIGGCRCMEHNVIIGRSGPCLECKAKAEEAKKESHGQA